MLAEKVEYGEVCLSPSGWHPHGGCWAWLWKGLGGHWVGHFSSCLHKQVQKTLLSLYRASISGPIGSFQVGQAFAAWKTTTIVISLTSGYGQGQNLHALWLKFPVLAPSTSENTTQKRFSIESESYLVKVFGKITGIILECVTHMVWEMPPCGWMDVPRLNLENDIAFSLLPTLVMLLQCPALTTTWYSQSTSRLLTHSFDFVTSVEPLKPYSTLLIMSYCAKR